MRPPKSGSYNGLPMPVLIRILGALAVLSLPATYLAAQIDFLRRHSPGITPQRYWLPQLTHIWAPGMVVALFFGLTAFLLHKKGRRDWCS